MSWTPALYLLVQLEGGYQDTMPPEGETYAGVMKKYYVEWCQQHGRDPVWPPPHEAYASYVYDAYWLPFRCDAFPNTVDAVALQLVFNLPPERARQMLQVALGVFPDGVIGPKTLAAINGWHSSELADRILVAQAAHYCDARPVTDADFKGLQNRIDRVKSAIAQGQI